MMFCKKLFLLHHKMNARKNREIFQKDYFNFEAILVIRKFSYLQPVFMYVQRCQ
jgi:hypothetical protein